MKVNTEVTISERVKEMTRSLVDRFGNEQITNDDLLTICDEIIPGFRDVNKSESDQTKLIAAFSSETGRLIKEMKTAGTVESLTAALTLVGKLREQLDGNPPEIPANASAKPARDALNPDETQSAVDLFRFMAKHLEPSHFYGVGSDDFRQKFTVKGGGCSLKWNEILERSPEKQKRDMLAAKLALDGFLDNWADQYTLELVARLFSTTADTTWSGLEECNGFVQIRAKALGLANGLYELLWYAEHHKDYGKTLFDIAVSKDSVTIGIEYPASDKYIQEFRELWEKGSPMQIDLNSRLEFRVAYEAKACLSRAGASAKLLDVPGKVSIEVSCQRSRW